MASASQRRLQALSNQLQSPPSRAPESDLPSLKTVAPDSTGPRLRDKVIILTGCSSALGIGRASAHQFAAHKPRALFICDYRPDYLETHAQDLQSLYPDVEVHVRVFDAADEDAVKRIVSEAVEKYGRLDVFFANAGIVGPNKPFWSVDVEEFEKTQRTNVLSVFLALKHATPAMQRTSKAKPQPGGSFIATASVAGLRSNAGGTDYSASKAAVLSLIQTSTWQLAGSSVRCNAILPGLIETGMTVQMYDMARERGTEGKIGQLNPLRRGGHADEIARMALFLASDESSYVNGQGIAVDGGLSAGLPVALAGGKAKIG